MRTETIAAISTGMTASGISIIRISGPEAIRIADRVFRGKCPLTQAKSHTLHHGFVEKDGVSYDEVLVSVMKAPHTYTGEDTAEINCHGGLFVAKEILSLLFSEGASPAEPGEFTKRAFLNGRMDLSEAEAVMEVIRADNEYALRAGLSGLKGKIAEKIYALRDRMLDEISFIEAALDDPEHYSLEGFTDAFSTRIDGIFSEMRELLRQSENGSLIREGIRTVIAGCPNAGKSSLLNLLSGYDKSIVTEIPGTTRDIVEETVRMGPLTLILLDTAGLRESDDPVERIGVDRARNVLSGADLVLYVADATAGLSAEDQAILSSIEPDKVILLYNKADLLKEPEGDKNRFKEGILFSCRTGQGRDVLEKEIENRFYAGAVSYNQEVILTNERQIALLKEAISLISSVKEGVRDAVSEEFLSGDLLGAYTALGKIVGEAVEDDVVDRIFEKFCMGK